MNAENLGGIPRQRIAAIFEAERASYVAAHPRSLALAGHGIAGFYQGVPMHWMRDWSMPYPFLVESARGAVLRDVDGNEYVDDGLHLALHHHADGRHRPVDSGL